MDFYVSPKKIYSVLHFFGKMLLIWPQLNTKNRFTIVDFLYSFCIANYILIFLPTLYGLYLNRNNIDAIPYSCLEVTGYCEAMWIMFHSRLQKSRFEALYALCEERLSNLAKTETIVNYFNTYLIGFFIIIASYSFMIAMYLFLDRPPTGFNEVMTSAVYPFQTNSSVVRGIIKSHQFFVLSHMTILPNFDGIAVFLIFMCTHRLKILESKFQGAKEFDELKQCIDEHNIVLKACAKKVDINLLKKYIHMKYCLYSIIKETNDIVRFIILKTVLSFVLSVFGSGLQALNNTAFTQFVHQIAVLTLAYARIILCAESSQNLTTAGEDVEYAIYSTEWYQEALHITKAKIFIMRKCKELPTISVTGVMTVLDRKYLGLILTSTISYFLTLRTITGSK